MDVNSSRIRQESQQNYRRQKHSAGTPATAAGTCNYIISRRETCNKRDARNSRDANNSTSMSRGANSTVKLPATHGVSRKFVKKDTKRVKIPNFGPIDFTQSVSYRTIGSLMLLVRQLKLCQSDFLIIFQKSDSYHSIGISELIQICPPLVKQAKQN